MYTTEVIYYIIVNIYIYVVFVHEVMEVRKSIRKIIAMYVKQDQK